MTERNLLHRAKALPLSFSRLLTVLAFLLAFAGSSFAQDQQGISYSVKLDTNIITIGDQINMELKIKQPPGMKVDFPQFRDSIVSGVEIISQTGPDTIKTKDGMMEVKKDFLLTSFDGGVYKIPPMEFTVHQQNFLNILRSDTLALGVRTFEIDTTKANFDIVMPYTAPVTFMEVAPYGFGGLLALGLIAFLVYYFIRRSKNKPIFKAPEKPRDPAHVIALRELDQLKMAKLWQAGKIKEYHTKLTDTIRFYLEERFGIATMECTSEEILGNTKDLADFDLEMQSKLEDILMRADLVKFAKWQPLPDENDRSLAHAVDLVNGTIIKSAPVAEAPQESISESNEETNPKPLN